MFARILRTILGILLIPVCIGVGKAFYTMVPNISASSDVFYLLQNGVLAYFVFHVIAFRPAYIYVIGHEIVHVLATWLCGGRIVSFNISRSGGNVATSKTNFFIELSPYFVPIYTIFLGPIFLILRAIGRSGPFTPNVFIFLVGFTLAFHFAMTSEVLRLKQPDVVKSGILFSLVCIFIGNLIVIMAVFCPLFDSLSFLDFVKSAASNSASAYRAVIEAVVKFKSFHNI